MAKSGGFTSMWKTILQIALAVLLIVGGLSVILDKAGNDELGLVAAVGGLFNGTVKDIVIYVMAAIELIAGILLILDFFKIKSLDKIDDLFLLIIMIAWIVVFVILGDIIPLIKGNLKFLPFIVKLARDAVMIAAFGIIKAKI
ncbi:MAG: hypothetical protein J6B81_00455 [Spirochaetaceae bacterium]|nr:hypothetical protein [Spirochaetaceae bacterium]